MKNISSLFNTLYSNQIDFGQRIVNALHTHQHIVAFANTQCGKTGSMLAAIHLSNAPLHSLFIITGLSSIDWLVQTKQRIPIQNIFHRNTMHLFFKAVSLISNPIIFIDESHIASKPGQIIHKVLSSVHARFIHVSATHDWKTIKPLKPGWCIRVMQNPDGYIGIDHFRNSGQLLQCKNVSDHPDAISHIQEIIPFLGKPAYHIIRTPRVSDVDLHSITIANFTSVFPDYIHLSMPNLNILTIQPSIHTFIYIKDTLRCAVTIPKPYIGILYDRFTLKPNPASVIQGLLGRATGFNSSHIVVFTLI
jgi:hypothetical protein